MMMPLQCRRRAHLRYSSLPRLTFCIKLLFAAARQYAPKRRISVPFFKFLARQMVITYMTTVSYVAEGACQHTYTPLLKYYLAIHACMVVFNCQCLTVLGNTSHEPVAMIAEFSPYSALITDDFARPHDFSHAMELLHCFFTSPQDSAT